MKPAFDRATKSSTKKPCENAGNTWIFTESDFCNARCDAMRAFASRVAIMRITMRAKAGSVWCSRTPPVKRVSVFFIRIGVIRLQCMSILDCTVPTSPHPVARRAAKWRRSARRRRRRRRRPGRRSSPADALRLHVERDVMGLVSVAR